MTGFATFAAYEDALRLTARYRMFNKATGSAIANVPYTYWRQAGIPAAGTVPTVGLGGAVACNKDTVGSIETVNAAAGQSNYLSRFSIGRASAINNVAGTYLICDRLAHANVTHNQATGAFSPVIDGTARLNAGEGAMIFMEVTTAFSAASNTITLTYTNEAGTTGRVTQNIVTVASSVVDRAPYADFIWVNLQAGDRGARTITDWTLVAGTGTGNVTISLVRPLCWISQPHIQAPAEREFGIMKQALDEVRNGACLFPIWIPGAIGTVVAIGSLTIVTG